MGAPSDARSSRPPLERLRVLRELGSPMGADVAFCAALESSSNKTRLVVVERILKTGGVLSPDMRTWLDHAKQLVPLEHPNVARVRDAIDGPEEAYVVSDFIDGARWTDVVAAGSGIPIDVALRVLIDALGGLGALHNMRDAARQPLGLVHCGVSSETVLVGLDGVSRIIGASRLRGLAPGVGAHYLAPEVLLEDDAADARADVYSIGVLLWEALTGRRLFTETGVSAIVTAVLSGRIPRAEVPESAPWAAPLVDVAARAIAPDPAKRYASAAALAAELRRIGGSKIVPSLRVAALVRSTFGDRIKARREELERGEVVTRAMSGVAAVAPRAAAADEEVVPTSSAPTPVPPPPTATTRPPPPMNAHEVPRVPAAPLVPSAVAAVTPATVSDPPISLEAVSVESVSHAASAAAGLPVTAPAFPVPGIPPKAPPFSDGFGSMEDEELTVARAAPLAAPAVNAPALSQPPVVPVVAAPLVPRELRGARSLGPSGAGGGTFAPSVIASLAEVITAPKNKRVVLIASAATAVLVFAIGAVVVFGGGKDDDTRAATTSEQAAGEGHGAGAHATPAAVTSKGATLTTTPAATATATATAIATAAPTASPTPVATTAPAAAPSAAASAEEAHTATAPGAAAQAPAADEPASAAALPPPQVESPPPRPAPKRPVIKYDPQGI